MQPQAHHSQQVPESVCWLPSNNKFWSFERDPRTVPKASTNGIGTKLHRGKTKKSGNTTNWESSRILTFLHSSENQTITYSSLFFQPCFQSNCHANQIRSTENYKICTSIAFQSKSWHIPYWTPSHASIWYPKKVSFELFDYAKLRTYIMTVAPSCSAACFAQPGIFESRTTDLTDMAWYLLWKQSMDYNYPQLKKHKRESFVLWSFCLQFCSNVLEDRIKRQSNYILAKAPPLWTIYNFSP